MVKRGRVGAAVLAAALAAVTLAACGDQSTTDTRGYTKAPLENPDVFITPEPTTPMSRLGVKPNLPPVVVIPPPDTTKPLPKQTSKG